MPAFTVLNPATEEPVAEVEPTHRGGGRRGDRARRRRPGGLARRGARRAGGAAAQRSPTWSTRTSASWPNWRSPAPGTRPGRPGGRPATSGTCCATTPPRRNGCAASRSRCRAGSTSPSTSRSAWSASSCRGTSPCRSSAGGLAPALAAGNPVIAKPAERTPLTAVRIGELALRGGAARGRVPGAAGQGLGGGPAAGRPPGRAQDRLHRVVRGWPRDHGRLRPAGEAAHHGTGRQERQHRVRRRRPGAGGRHRAGRRVRQRRPGLLRPVPDPGPAQRVRRGSWNC